MRHRLYHRILVTLILFILAAVALSSLAGHLLLSALYHPSLGDHFTGELRRIGDRLPAGESPSVGLQQALETASAEARMHASLYSARGERLAFTTVELPGPSLSRPFPQWLPTRQGPSFAARLGDGRILVLQPRRSPRPAVFVMAVLGMAAILAAATYPVARLVTRRLEHLESGVRRLGEGDLAVRVPVRGRDELASLATSFNQAAERLQRLVEAQRRVLASASHELRSPLTRLRMSLELLRDHSSTGHQRLDEAVKEVEELDALVEELLVAGRLEIQNATKARDAVDVADIVVEEAARAGASASTVPVSLHIDSRLVRVVVRNLLENAVRHGKGSPVEAGCEPLGAGGVRIWVADRGPGVAEEDRNRIFEPFFRSRGHAETTDGGVGLGLYLVRRIAEWYLGSAEYRSREGGGALAEVLLHEPAEEPAARSQ